MYVKDRLTGFDGESRWPVSGARKWRITRTSRSRWKLTPDQTVLTTPACTSEIRVKMRRVLCGHAT